MFNYGISENIGHSWHGQFIKEKQLYIVNAGIIQWNSIRLKIKKIYKKLQTLFKDSTLTENQVIE